MDVLPLVLGFAGGTAGTAIINHFLSKDDRVVNQLLKQNDNLLKQVNDSASALEKKQVELEDCMKDREDNTKRIRQLEVDVQKMKNKLIQANLYDEGN